MGRTSKAARQAYRRDNYDVIRIYVPKGKRDELRAWCDAHYTSMGRVAKEGIQARTGIQLV